MANSDLAWMLLAVVAPLLVLRPGLTEARPFGLFRPGLVSFALGAFGFGVSLALQALVADRTGIRVATGVGEDAVRVSYALFIVGPIEETLRLAAVIPSLRSKDLKRPYDAMRLSIASAVGFATLANLHRLWGAEVTAQTAIRAMLGTVAIVSLSAMWGFSIGRERRRKIGGRVFSRSFLGAVIFSTLATHLLFARGESALFAALPLVFTALIAALVARRDLKRSVEGERRARLTRVLPLHPPSIEEIEHALLRPPSRSVSIGWIVFGAFVTSGVLVVAVLLAVVLGNRAGVDFAAVDQATSLERTALPLVLLGTSVLGAFPVSGFLVARASAAEGVLEPALAASISIIGFIVLLGLAAPVAVVFGLALGPVAFALTCVGAWVGLER